jgi:hypothetical protein
LPASTLRRAGCIGFATGSTGNRRAGHHAEFAQRFSASGQRPGDRSNLKWRHALMSWQKISIALHFSRGNPLGRHKAHEDTRFYRPAQRRKRGEEAVLGCAKAIAESADG